MKLLLLSLLALLTRRLEVKTLATSHDKRSSFPCRSKVFFCATHSQGMTFRLRILTKLSLNKQKVEKVRQNRKYARSVACLDSFKTRQARTQKFRRLLLEKKHQLLKALMPNTTLQEFQDIFQKDEAFLRGDTWEPSEEELELDKGEKIETAKRPDFINQRKRKKAKTL